MLKKENRTGDFTVCSRATSTEELGNPVHPGTRRVLDRLGISCKGKFAQQITKKECDVADLIIIMDENNRRNLSPFIGNNAYKVKTLLSYAGLDRDIADPWWTGNFEDTYEDVKLGLNALWKEIN
jgi:protein-tyrosine phosphatase